MPDISKFPRGVPKRELAPNATWKDHASILDFNKNPTWRFEGDNRDGKIFLGSLGTQMIGVKDNRHLMTIAGSRSGKGVSTIIPNLITYPGSILVIDPKGENARITKNRRDKGSKTKKGLGQEVFVLDPFGRSGHATSSFNPLSMIDPENDQAVDDAALVAEALIIPQHGEAKHWSDAARNFLRGLILYVRVALPADMQNLLWVRRLLTIDPDGFKKLLKAMEEQENRCNGVIRGASHSMTAKAETERSGVISTAIEQTDFLDSPLMASVLEKSSFSLRDLKRNPRNPRGTTIYLCLPAGRMATHNRWLRVIINLAIQAMEDEETKPDYPVLFLMDEFAVLDHLSSIEKAAGQIAGFGVKLWPILQDLSQLQSIYKDGWETFMGNAGLIQCFGNNDLTTLEYLSRRLGKCTIEQISKGEADLYDNARNKFAETKQPHETQLMTSDEIGYFFSRQKEAQLLLWAGDRPIALDRVIYHDKRYDWFFSGTYDPHPDYV